MSKRTQNARACVLTDQYLAECPSIFEIEKMSYYIWALNEAKSEMYEHRYEQSPLDILWGMFDKFDTWAHKDGVASEGFKIAAAAIDDLIDYLLTDY